MKIKMKTNEAASLVRLAAFMTRKHIDKSDDDAYDGFLALEKIVKRIERESYNLQDASTSLIFKINEFHKEVK